MFMPKVLSKDDDFLRFPMVPDFFRAAMPDFAGSRELLTDLHEFDDRYELRMDIPGFDKEDIKIGLEEGQLIVSAEKNSEKEEKDKEGKIIRSERRSGYASRSFYVGEDIKPEDVSAKYENGVLTIGIPKKEEAKELPEKKYIAIK